MAPGGDRRPGPFDVSEATPRISRTPTNPRKCKCTDMAPSTRNDRGRPADPTAASHRAAENRRPGSIKAQAPQRLDRKSSQRPIGPIFAPTAERTRAHGESTLPSDTHAIAYAKQRPPLPSGIPTIPAPAPPVAPPHPLRRTDIRRHPPAHAPPDRKRSEDTFVLIAADHDHRPPAHPTQGSARTHPTRRPTQRTRPVARPARTRLRAPPERTRLGAPPACPGSPKPAR